MDDPLNNDDRNDEELKQEFKEALEGVHPEDVSQEDPFDTDALGNEPAEEDASGGGF